MSLSRTYPLWQRATGFGLAFWIAAEISQFLCASGSTYVSFWLPAGIYVATLLLNPTRTWPWFMLAALLANLAFDLPQGTPLGATGGFYAANTVEALTGALLTRRFVAQRPDVSVLKEFLGLTLCTAGAGTVFGATIGATTLVGSGMSRSFFEAWATWWGNETMAILLVAPFILVWTARPGLDFKSNGPWNWLEGALMLAGTAGLAWYLLVDYKGIMGPYKIWLLAFLLWAALRFGLRGATMANLLLALLTGFLTTHFLTGLTPVQVSTGAYTAVLQSFLGVAVMMTLVPAIILSERNRTVAELRESEARFRNLTEASFEAVCITENGRLVDVNDQGLKMMGYRREEVIGRQIIDCIAPETRAHVAEMIQTGRDAIYELRLIRKDGTFINTEARAKMVRSGSRTLRMTAVRDITERKKIEEVLKAGESRLRMVLDSLPAAAYTCNAQGLITYVNQQAVSMWGRMPKLNDAADTFCGSFKLYALDGRPISHDQCWMAVALAEKRTVTGRQIVIERPDGVRRTVLAHASPLFDGTGKLEGAVNVLTDITELKQAKEALAESEALLRNFIKQSPAAMAMFDTEMQYLQVTDRWLDQFLSKEVKVIGRSHYEVFTNIPERWKEAHRRVLAGATERSDRDLLVRNDGTSDWVQWEAQPWHLASGTIGGLILTAQIITERIGIEEALRLSEDKFRSALSHSPIGMALVGLDGRWIEVNPALCKIVGYASEELLATDFQTITHPDDLEPDINLVRQMLDHQIKSYELEKRYLHKNGQIVWVQLNVSLVWNPDGTPRYFVSQVQNITERKRAEAALQENQAKLVLAMDMARLAHWEYDMECDRLTVDERIFKYYGTTAAEHGGVSLSSSDYIRKFVHPEDASIIPDEIARALAATDPSYTRQFEKRIIRADGSIRVIQTRFTIVKDAAGRTIKAYGANQDITEQKQAALQQHKLEEQLRQAQKMEALGTLAGGTAHEFNNMLGIILGYSELIKTELDDSHPSRPDLDEILKAGQRAKEIIRQILTFSRQQMQPREEVLLTDVVLGAVNAVRATLPSTVTIHKDLVEGDSRILANRAQIHQVLMNIFTNAWHAVENRGGNIRLTLRAVKLGQNAAEIHPALREGSYVHLSVADDGIGIDAATLARIFEPFFTTKGQGKGTGLGLAVVHGIMQAHEGAVFAQSKPGDGTTFHLYFPASQAAVKPLKNIKMETKNTPKESRHILLVDDEPSLIQVTSKFLQRAGYQTTSVPSATEALAALERQPKQFHLVITDLTMPEMSGAALAEKLHEKHSHLPVIIVSGFDGAEALNGVTHPNIRALLQKPFTPDTLVRTIQSALAGQTVNPAMA